MASASRRNGAANGSPRARRKKVVIADNAREVRHVARDGDLKKPAKLGRARASSEDYVSPSPAAVAVEASLALCVAALLASVLLRDLRVGGLGASNGRIVSFVASLNCSAGFRRQKVAVEANSRGIKRSEKRRRLGRLHLGSKYTDNLHKAKLFLLVFVNKFGTQSLGSLLVGATPVILKGPRHIASWLLAFLAVQAAPRDVVYDSLQRHVALQLVVKAGAALYKLRKFNFVAGACDACAAWQYLLAMTVTIDGNNFCSRFATYTWLHEGLGAADARYGLLAFARRASPVVAAALLVRCCGIDGRLFVTDARVTETMRVAVFCVFLYRNDVPSLSARFGRAVLRLAGPISGRPPPPPSPPNTPVNSPGLFAAEVVHRAPPPLDLKRD